MGAINQNPTTQRVATTLPNTTLERVEAERARIAVETGIKPSLAKVIAAAVERGLPR